MVKQKQFESMRQRLRKFEKFASGFFEEKPRGESNQTSTASMNWRLGADKK
jgi:hypothetical protein